MTTELWEQDNFGKERKCILPLEYKNMNYPYSICKLCYTGVSLFCASVNSAHLLIGLSHYNVKRQRMPTYEKFRKNVCVRCIRWGYVLHKLRTRYHTLAYAGVRCNTSNLSENFVHEQNFQRMPTY